MLICAGCKNSKQDQGQHEDSAFNPKGTMADLVYNPMRPDGTLDSSFLPIMTLRDSVFDFGSVPEGDTVTHVFTVEPGNTGEITVKFNSAGRRDHQSKEVTIFANTFPNEHKVRIKGNVVKRN
jgi:hypothetical protein